METGFRCPNCGSYQNHWIPFTVDDIECEACDHKFNVEDCRHDGNDDYDY